MVARRHIGLDAAGFLQRAAEELRRDGRRVDRLAVDGDGGVGDDIGGVETVLVGLGAVGRIDIVDQTLIERPGIHPALPVVDDGVAEAEGFRLLVPRTRRTPRIARRVQRRIARRCDQRLDGGVERPGRGERVLVAGERDVGIIGEDVGIRRLGGKRRRRQRAGAQHQAQSQQSHRPRLHRGVAAP